MEQRSCYLPEGSLIESPQNNAAIGSEAGLREAILTGQRLEARVRVCDGGHNLHVELPCMHGLIPRAEGALGISEGTVRDIALISRVNKPVCFSVLRIEHDENGEPVAVLSRRLQQEHCHAGYISRLKPGDVITGDASGAVRVLCGHRLRRAVAHPDRLDLGLTNLAPVRPLSCRGGDPCHGQGL